MELKEHLNKMKEMYPILSTKYNNKVYGTREDDRDEIVKMMADLRVLIKQGVNKDDNYLFHNSTQTGSITYNPYIVIKNKNISFVDEKRKESPRNDYYIVIYFDTNFDNLHISLNQGSERDNEDRGLVDGNITDGNIRDISLYLRRYFIPKIYNKFEVGEGKLQTGSKKTSEYNNTNIWSVTFSVDNSFSDLDFFSDLNIALDVYNEFIIRLELNKYDADYINKKISRNINNKIYDLDFRTTLTMISDGEKDKSQCNAFNDAMAKYDLFNREKLISSLINLISSPRTGTPISIGLFGDWG